MNSSNITAPRLREYHLRWFSLLCGLALLASLLPQVSRALRPAEKATAKQLSAIRSFHFGGAGVRRNEGDEKAGLKTASQPFFVTAATTFTVTNTNDSGPGSLRQAITDANANPGLDTISFNIGSGPQTITPLQRLPTLTDAVVIDGTTQPGFSGTPIVELNGTLQPDGNGLFIIGGNSTVRGLVLNGFHFGGILMDGNGGNRVEGCYIGTDITGTVARSNGSNGISIRVSNNFIGGTTPAERNVISGNGDVGIDISRPCCTADLSPIIGNLIQGNYIGVNAAGNGGIANQRQGIRISNLNSGVDVTGNMVGGTQAGAGNVISGNHFEGILLEGTKVKNNSVQGNFIGTDVTGSYSIPNDGDGVSISGTENLIGGSVSGARNIISGNGRNGSGISGGNGVGLGIAGAGNVGPGNVVQGNIIGANATLTAPLPNFQYGIAISQSNSIVGGVGPGEANIIAFNGFDGIRSATTTATSNLFRGNSIFSNGYHTGGTGIGIDLGSDDPTPNDAGDADAGANNLQNFPVITSVNVNVNSVNIQGTLNSTASQSFNLDFYANSACDPQAFGEGARRIGSASVTTDAGGDGNFDITFALSLPANQVLTATATDAAGNTSEFSQCFPGSPAVGSVAFSNTFVDVVEGFDSEALFVVNRTGGTSGSLTVGYVVTGETATAGSDFTPTQGTLTFADGETSRSFTVPILDDNVNDLLAETAHVSLTTLGDLDTLGSRSFATLTIEDDDPRPSLSISDVSVNEGSSGTTNATFTVSLSAASAQTVTVQYMTVPGTATAGNDYQTASGTVTFNPGDTSKPVTVVVNGDVLNEPSETFFVNLSSANNATIADAQGQGTIIDAALKGGTLQFSSATFSRAEDGGNAVITVNRTGGTAGEALVNYATSNGTATAGQDYTAASGTLIFPDGITSKSFNVAITNDVVDEPDETITLTLTSPAGSGSLGVPASALLTITDNDPAPGISINDVSTTEGDSGTVNAIFTVTLSGQSSQTVTVNFATADGTATADNDYQANSGTVTFLPLETAKPITVTVNGDINFEPNETFFVNLSAPVNATISDSQGGGTITNDDAQGGFISFSQANYTVGESGGFTTITVRRTNDLSGPATVDYATSDDSGSTTVVPCSTANGIASSRCDFTTALGTLRFAVGENSKTFVVLISQDNYVEGSESLTLTLSNLTGGAAFATPSAATLTITDDATEPATNPIDTADAFVHQHYHDFLNREADAAGLAFWTNQITECQQPGSTCSAEVRRINVSAAFFLSIEFQETGYLVERLYKVAYSSAIGNSSFGGLHVISVPIVRFKEFLTDTQQIGQGVVVGQAGWEHALENNKLAFALDFVSRARFTNAYATTLTPAEFVDALFVNAGVTPSATDRDAAINEFGGAGNTADTAARARVVRRVAENSTLKQLETNSAFVLMQYIGYLRRNPNDAPDSDYTGYDFWLTKLNQFNGNFVNAEMVKAFIVSGEYRQRFGP